MTSNVAPSDDVDYSAMRTRFLWLEITGSCQLECDHCYASSGPGKSHGVMTEADWCEAIRSAAQSDVSMVQFIGGEPTTHPAFRRLVELAISLGLEVEVFSNLFLVSEAVWSLLQHPQVCLATSYYASRAVVHDAITNRPGSYVRTKANIEHAISLGIKIRVGVIRLGDQQDVDAAIDELVAIGVSRERIGYDDIRGVGRGKIEAESVTESELCGNCASGVAAIMPDGTVQPCVFSRDERFTVGNVRNSKLHDILSGSRLSSMRRALGKTFSDRRADYDCPPFCEPVVGPCNPSCNPNCNPQCLPECWPGCNPNCGPSCSPACIPEHNCNPTNRSGFLGSAPNCSPACNPTARGK